MKKFLTKRCQMKKLLKKRRQINNFLTIVPAITLIIILAITLVTACGGSDTPDGSDSVNEPDSKKR